MPRLRAHNIAVSLDGYMAGPQQSLENPLGVGGEGLHEWVFATRAWREQQGQDGGETGIDNDFAARGEFVAYGGGSMGATIMGRHMFTHSRGPWPDDGWRGWWGDDPPYHHPTFVLTHHARDPIPMDGGTTFYFVTDGIEAALERAVEAAGGKDVRLGGGASAIRQYMRAGLLDEIHIAVAPILLGGGERPLDDLGGAMSAYERIEFVASRAAAHYVLRKK